MGVSDSQVRRLTEESDEVLNRDETAALLKMAPSTLAGMASRRVGPPFARIGGSVRYLRKDVMKWVEGNVVRHRSE